MRTVQVTDKAVTIRLSGEPVPDKRALAGMVRRALEGEGLVPWGETEAECFSDGEETLIIARPGRARRAFFFRDLEALLAGVLCCPAGESSLYAAPGGGYLLMAAPEIVRPGLYEFGAPVPMSPEREAHLREHGRCIAAAEAAADLRRHFATEPMWYSGVC